MLGPFRLDTVFVTLTILLCADVRRAQAQCADFNAFTEMSARLNQACCSGEGADCSAMGTPRGGLITLMRGPAPSPSHADEVMTPISIRSHSLL